MVEMGANTKKEFAGMSSNTARKMMGIGTNTVGKWRVWLLTQRDIAGHS